MMKSEFLTRNGITPLLLFIQNISPTLMAQISWLILHIQLTIDQILKTFVISNETMSVKCRISREKTNAMEKLWGQGCISPAVLVELEKMK